MPDPFLCTARVTHTIYSTKDTAVVPKQDDISDNLSNGNSFKEEHSQHQRFHTWGKARSSKYISGKFRSSALQLCASCFLFAEWYGLWEKIVPKSCVGKPQTLWVANRPMDDRVKRSGGVLFTLSLPYVTVTYAETTLLLLTLHAAISKELWSIEATAKSTIRANCYNWCCCIYQSLLLHMLLLL